jgi:hypothetical protein
LPPKPEPDARHGQRIIGHALNLGRGIVFFRRLGAFGAGRADDRPGQTRQFLPQGAGLVQNVEQATQIARLFGQREGTLGSRSALPETAARPACWVSSAESDWRRVLSVVLLAISAPCALRSCAARARALSISCLSAAVRR